MAASGLPPLLVMVSLEFTSVLLSVKYLVNIYRQINHAAKEYGCEDNFVAGANIAAFKKVADAMHSQGIV